MHATMNQGFMQVLTIVATFALMSQASAQMQVLLEDDFDDGDWDGWFLANPLGESEGQFAEEPVFVKSPEGYALAGFGKGYGEAGLHVYLSHFFPYRLGEMSVEFRAKSGPQLPNQIAIAMFAGSSTYTFVDYGEGNQEADLYVYVDGWENDDVIRYPIGDLAFEWHDFRWDRDADGRWSLSIDGELVAENLCLEPGFENNTPGACDDWLLEDFSYVSLHLLRNQSMIE